MKQHPTLIAIALSTTLLCGSILCNCVSAETPDDRRFGNGRFLRRLRDDVAGKSKADSKQKDDAKKPTKADPKSKGAKSKNAAPTLAKRPAKGAPKTAARPSAATNQKNSTRKDSQQTSEGFGMKIEPKNEQLIVTKTDSRGNAAEAGVRKGDVVVTVGGVEIGSMEELEEITKILGEGDQLEFEIARRGQKKKVLIQYGEAPEEGEVVITKPETPAKKVSNYNFLPEPAKPSANSLRSVLSDTQGRSGNFVPPSINRIPQPATQTSPQPRQRLSETQAIIEQQRLQIQQMQLEIERLRRQTGATNNGQASSWNSPSLTGPEK